MLQDFVDIERRSENDPKFLTRFGKTKVRISSWWRDKCGDKRRHLSGQQYPGVTDVNAPPTMRENCEGSELQLKFVACSYTEGHVVTSQLPWDILKKGEYTTVLVQIYSCCFNKYLRMDTDHSLAWSDEVKSDERDYSATWILELKEDKDLFTIKNFLYPNLLNGSTDNVLDPITDDDHLQNLFYLELI